MVKQQYDFSCGSAALASLLTYHYRQPVDENEVLKAMYDIGDREKIQKVGFSLLDMKKYLESLDLKADGFHTTLDKLVSVGIPAIALVNNKGYMHFVVIKGVTKDRILLGDPANGTRAMDREEFEKSWNGILFVITSNMETARANFNRRDEWGLRSAPVSDAVLRSSLADMALNSAFSPNHF